MELFLPLKVNFFLRLRVEDVSTRENCAMHKSQVIAKLTLVIAKLTFLRLRVEDVSTRH